MTTRRPLCHRATWIAMAIGGLLVPGCTKAPPQPAAPTARVFAADVTGAAASCDAPKLSPAPDQPTEATIKLGNDGGWCGITVVQKNGQAFGAGLLTNAAAHGKVLIHRVGDATRIDYTPDRSFTGSDAFAVRLLPGDATLKVSVAVAR